MATYYIRETYINQADRELDWPREYEDSFDGSANDLLEKLLWYKCLDAEDDVRDGLSKDSLSQRCTTFEIYSDPERKNMLCNRTINHLDAYNQARLVRDSEDA